MKKTATNRYPHAATLFKFCKEALEIKYEGNVKVIDQDVGAILGYDPADCSHWKKGKKNIRALTTLRSIADHLNVDERLLIDITAGRLNLQEAVFEYNGYGNFSLVGRNLDVLKKEYFKDSSRYAHGAENATSFSELFDVKRKEVLALAESILKLASFTEGPIYLPEILALFPNITLKAAPALEVPILTEFHADSNADPEGAKYTAQISYNGDEMRPFTRFLATKELFKILIKIKFQGTQIFTSQPEEVQEIQANIFAGIILVPSDLLAKEVENIDGSIDLITQLAEIFWVSKALMNQRLRDFMDYSEI